MKKAVRFLAPGFKYLSPRWKIIRKLSQTRGKSCFLFLLSWLAILCSFLPLAADDFKLDLSLEINRPWPGPDFFASNFEDWQVKTGRLQCLTPALNRYVYFLTGEMEGLAGGFQASFKAKINSSVSRPRLKNYIGLRVGIKGKDGDYRQSAVAGGGLDLGLTTDGLLFIGDLESVSSIETQEIIKAALMTGVEFKIRVEINDGGYQLELGLYELQNGKLLNKLEDNGPESEKVKGGLALVSSLPEMKINQSSLSVSEFWQLELEGDLLETHPERQLGPLAFTLYSLNRSQLKLRAQAIPGSLPEESLVAFEVEDNGQWQRTASEKIQPENAGVLFSIKDWNSKQTVTYRLVILDKNGQETRLPSFRGQISSEPDNPEEIRLAVLASGSEIDYPYSQVVASLKNLNPDVLFFGGNQVFGRPPAWWQEEVSPDRLKQEYLRQWILFGWAFADLLKDRPAIITPEARDYFQLKLWGNGGKTDAGEKASNFILGQDEGGFLLPAEFIRLVLVTQTSHLPDSPAPELTGIGLKPYYCQVNYGGLSLAVLDDRMFKTPPGSALPEAKIRNGWAENPAFDVLKEAEAKRADLHGKDQLDFLQGWAEDWSGQVEFKAALSQSLWVCLETTPAGVAGDEALFKSPPPLPGEYPPDDQPTADFNSGGWPKNGRDEAIKILRKALAIHLAGGGGPAASLRYGLSRYDEASYAFVPKPLMAASKLRWFPRKDKTATKTAPVATGNLTDAFGNRFSVKAVANPSATADGGEGHEASGFGLVRFKKDGTIIFENWSVTQGMSWPGSSLLSGWPISSSFLENEGRRPAAYLPSLRFKGLDHPVVQVVEERSQEVIYTLRIKENEFRPPVFRAGTYSVCCGEPGTDNWKEIKKLTSLPAGVKKIKVVDFSADLP
ncbi:MAG: hypothetical protein PHU81_06935 [Acidobacteriota bacterium]|nr:hypothetical protein [Acidobacteriota bacterium]